jgi:hypothetical protein
MPPADNSAHLQAAAARRHQDAVDRATTAIRQLDAEGKAITFRSVAATGGVSRAFLYGNEQLKSTIRNLRQQGTTTTTRVPTRERASDASKDARIRHLQEEVHRLRDRNANLEQQNAVLLGRLRSNRSASAT